MTVTVKQTASSKYRIQFIGKGGRLLSEVAETPGDLHVRGRRRLRARASAREQRPDGLVPAGDAEIGPWG